MSTIIDIKARQILDSRGNPTVEVDVILEDGSQGRASVPSGASTGTHEAHELRDGDAAKMRGLTVFKAVSHVTGEIASAIIGMDGAQQLAIDEAMLDLDDTPNKTRLGANAILGVSLAVAKAQAKSMKLPLFRYIGGLYSAHMPTPLMNVLNGGCHADNALDIQEFMLFPLKSTAFHESLYQGVEVFHALKSLLKQKGLSTNTGDEGGFAPAVSSARQALDLLSEAVERAGYKLGEDMGFGLDVAATELFRDGRYHMEGNSYNSQELAEFYGQLADAYPIVSIEDGMAEDDWEGWALLTDALGSSLQLVGDDLFVTNVSRLEAGLEQGVANAVLVKPNQIGTLTETAVFIDTAHRHGYAAVMSHRSGETEDTTIADLAVGFGCEQIKTGSLSRSDRLAKYNQLLRIEEELSGSAALR